MRNHFQVISVNDGRPVSRLIVSSPKLLEVFSQSRLRVFVERAKRLLRRPVIEAKMLDNFSGTERKDPTDILKLCLHLRDAFTEALTNSFFNAPQHRRRHARRKWKMLRRRLEHPSNKTA